MRIFCVSLGVALVCPVAGLERPLRGFSLVTNLATVTTDPVTTPAPNDRSVVGMCSAAQDAVGRTASATASGISTLTHCAQFGLDKSANTVYVSFNKEKDECMWFRDCQCLASSSTCLGGQEWRSVAVSDLIAPRSPAALGTAPAPIAQAAVVAGAAATTAAPGRANADTATPEITCDTSDSNGLMQSFQTKCEMNQSIWMTRLVAGSVMAVVILIVAGMFAIAYHFDGLELKALTQ